MKFRRNKSRNKSRKTGLIPVFVNVYDLSTMNEYAYWFGLGVFHSGVQVHDTEYGYGYSEEEDCGISEVEPKQCEGFTFRKQILIGWTEKNQTEVETIIEELAETYKGTSYNLITRNCNHFCNDLCRSLTGKSIPRWINRLARIGFMLNCIVPASLTTIRVGIEDDKMCNESKSKRSSRMVSSNSKASASKS